MEKNKLDISAAKSGPDPVSATYKPIPETDMEEQAVSRPKSLVKAKVDGSEVDGADEKMLPNDHKVPEVVVFANDTKSPQNGDAKLDIEEAPKQAFVGLTKEELMKYANDPFWVRLRWFLFISFWVLWAVMLVGAVLIIYAAPKCDPPPPRTWYQQGPLAELSSDAKQENVQIDENIKGVIVPWNKDSYEVLDNNPSGLELIKNLQKKGTKVIVQLDPTSSRVWFDKSERRDPLFDGYYIWKTGKNVAYNTTFDFSPPNNWLGPSNTSAWKYSTTRREFYYSPFAKPHLNFWNQSVVQEFNEVISKFVALNVSGIRLVNAPFLLADTSFEDEQPNIKADPSLSLAHYDFYEHSKTKDLLDLGRLLKGWRSLVKNKTEGPLMVAEELGKIDSYKIGNVLAVDLPVQARVFSKPVLSVAEIGNDLNYTFHIDGIEWPLWKTKTNALPKDVLDIITYLLPGTPLVNASEELNTVLLKIRERPSITRGICEVFGLQNNTVLAFIRVTPGNPGILVAVNPTNYRAVANIPAEVPPLHGLDEVTVRYYSGNYNESDFKDIGGKRNAAAVPITPRSALILEYVPKLDE